MRALPAALLIAAVLAGCGNAPDVRTFSADAYPERLSEWGLVWLEDGELTLAPESFVYDLNTPLFTDYALKLRTIYVPPGAAAQYVGYEAFEFPVGSVISKTFLYATNAEGAALMQTTWSGDPAKLGPNRVVETRLLVRQTDGWDALPYIWKGGDAYLSITGDIFTVATESDPLNYIVPSKNECASCHATNHTSGAIQPVGIKARHLNRPDPVSGQNQLTAWHARGQLEGLPVPSLIPANARWGEASASLDHQARSYLDINCGHCHNPAGAADTSGLLLDYQQHEDGALGVCKPPIAAGRGSGGHLYSIVPGAADSSIMTFRMATTDPATMMPELGRTLVHREGHALISRWVDAMQGECL